ncbi:MAG: DUF4339 domain-containing protein, partial [Candidatus Hydrogenedentota bacterium]
MSTWFYRKDGDNQGPIDEMEFQRLIATGEINSDTFVWQPSWADWKPYGAVTDSSQSPTTSPSPPSGLSDAAPPLNAAQLSTPTTSKSKGRGTLYIGIAVAVAAVVGIMFFLKNKEAKWGARVTIGPCELFRQGGITEKEAMQVLQLLADDGACEGQSTLSFQLRKEGHRIQFRMVTKQKAIHEEDTQKIIRGFGYQISTEVFGNAPVDVHLCDDSFRTVVTLAHSSSGGSENAGWGVRLANKKCELYRKPGITEEEAKGVLALIAGEIDCSDNTISFQLRRDGRVYVFRMVTRDESMHLKETADSLRSFGNTLSAKVLNNAPVDVHLCDGTFKTVVTLHHGKTGATPPKTSAADSDTKVSKKGCQVHFEAPITRRMAARALELLILDENCDGTTKSFMLNHEGGKNMFKMVTKPSFFDKAHFHHAFRVFASRLGDQIFDDGSKTEAHICDNQLRTVHKFDTFAVETQQKCSFFFGRDVAAA